MSRLDDELRFALRREEPPTDFAERVLKRIAAPAAKTSWRDKLKLLQLPRFRWVAVGVAASLIIAVGVIRYHNHQQVEPERNVSATQPDAAYDIAAAAAKPGADFTAPEIASDKAGQPLIRQARTTSRRAHANRAARDEIESSRQQNSVRAEVDGETAKQQLMLALHIASAKLSEAQKKIQGDD